MKFLVALLAAMGMMSLGWVAALVLQSGRPTASSQWIADAYAMKGAAAARIASPKIVIVAGSNALFGIDSKRFERALGRPVVNYGVNAGLLLPYVLLKSREALRPGDIVILPLEYHFYTYDGVPNLQMIDQIFSRDPAFFWELDWDEQLRMVWMMSLERMVEGFWARGGERAMCGPYGWQNIDEYGDQTHSSAAEAVPWGYDWENLARELPRRYGADAANTRGWKWLERYVAWAKARGVRLIVTPPTMMADPFYRDDPTERRFYAELPNRVRALGVPFVGNPYDFMYSREYYFNTDYHLNDAGRARHTEKLLEALIPLLSQEPQ